MKKRHAWKVANVPSREKEMLKMFNDPKFYDKLKDLNKLTESIQKTNEKLSKQKYDSLEKWSVFALSMMSQSLSEQTKEFQQKFLNLVELETKPRKGTNETL